MTKKSDACRGVSLFYDNKLKSNCVIKNHVNIFKLLIKYVHLLAESFR